jgi:hypothetical protein
LYHEVSAKSGAGIDELFICIAEEALKKLKGVETAGQWPKVELKAKPVKDSKKGLY